MSREASERNRGLAAAKRELASQRAARQREVAAERRSHQHAAWRERTDASQSRQRDSIHRALHGRDVSLLDLIDRLLDGGVVIHGDITLAVADVDLLYVGLRAMVASVETIERELGVSLSGRGTALDSSAV